MRKNEKITALYERLSRDDFGKDDDQQRESIAPEVKDLTRTEMTELMEHIFSLSEVQRAVRHMAITHTNQANREKKLKADGTISSERHAD